MSTGSELGNDQGAYEGQSPSDDIDGLFALDQGAGELRLELEAALTAVENAKQDIAIGSTPAVATLLRAPAAPASSITPVMQVAPVSPVAHVAHVEPVAPARAAGASALDRVTLAQQRYDTLRTRTILVLVGVLVVLNVSLVAIVSHSSASLSNAVSTLGSTPRPAPQQSTPASQQPSQPSAGERPEGYRTLDLARTDLEHGDHAFARRRLYTLLSVVDGVEQPARSDLEARADLAVADSYRLQAQALAREAQGGSR